MRDSSLDKTDPIAAMLEEEDKKDSEPENRSSQEDNKSSKLDKTNSDKLPPPAPPRKSPRVGPSRTVLKALDDDSMEHMD